MKAPRLGDLLVVVCVYLVVGSHADAQSRPSGRTSGTNLGVGMPVDPSSEPGSVSQAAFVSGKVTLDDGTELTEPAAIQTVCHGDRRTRAYTGHDGSFSFQLGDSSPSSTSDFSDASNTTMTRNPSPRDQRNWRECELQAVLAGFSSEVIELASRLNTLESTDVGRVVLHRLEHVEGTSISVTSALAPSGARKALEKGREAEKKKNWTRALQSLEKAVQIYPKYAVAWFELGRVQMMKDDLTAAKLSFQRSLAADSKYVPPYQGLAELSFKAKQWPEVVHATEQILALNPVSFPVAYFFNSVANYYLPDLEAAEKSARQGIKVDAQQQIAKLRYVLGMILLKKQEYQQASFYFRQYIKLTTESTELEAANKQLAEIAKLYPQANGDGANSKK